MVARMASGGGGKAQAVGTARSRDYPARIVVGGERRPSSGESCGDCGSPQGLPHRYGCPAEECPRCGGLLVGCPCTALHPAEGERVIKALYDLFRSLEEALAVVAARGQSAAGPSYLLHAAMNFLYEHLPEEARAELRQSFASSHPGLVPLLRDGEGRGYYTAEQLSQALAIPVAEVHERVGAMVEAGQKVHFADPQDGEKIN